MLTNTSIKKLKPSEKCKPSRPDKHSDSHGLQLWVRHTGTKVFYSAYRFQGKQQQLQLGKYPMLSLADARSLNQTIKHQIANGKDPKEERKQQKQLSDVSNLFDAIAEEWYADRKLTISPKTYNRNYSMYLRDIKPVIGHKHPNDVTKQDIITIGRTVENRGAYEMAKRTINQTKQIFEYAIALEKTENNPCLHTGKIIKTHKSKGMANVSHDELPKLLRDIESYTGNELIKQGLFLFAYTFVRTQELRLMKWQEIDFNEKVWRIPAENMKMGLPHIVPLCSQAIEILQNIKEQEINNTYVFYNSYKKQILSQNAFLQVLYRLGYRGKMTVHGFRHIASTTLHEKQYLHEAIELQLAHQKRDKVSASYNSAKHLPYRTKMMQEYLDQLKGGKLVIFPKQA